MESRLMKLTCLPLICLGLTVACPLNATAQSRKANFAGTTFAERWAWADTVIAGKCTKTSSVTHGMRVLHTHSFQTTRVFSDRIQAAKIGKKVTFTEVVWTAKKGSEYLIFNYKNARIGLAYPVPFSAELLAYLRKAPPPSIAPPKRVSYFLKHLGSANERIARDALLELANTAEKHYVSLSAESVALLEKTVILRSSKVLFGLDRLAAAYLLVKGSKGLDRLDTVLKADSTDFTVLSNAVKAMDFVWRNGEGRIPQDRMRKSLRLLLDRAEVAGHFVPKLTQWKDWTATLRLANLYGTKGYNSETTKHYIIAHLLSAIAHGPLKQGGKVPAHVVTARKHLAEIQKKDPALVAKARKSFNAETARRVTWRKGNLADPKIDKVATRLSGVPVRNYAVHVVRFHPDGNTVVAGSGDGTIRLWNVTTGALHHKLKPHTTWCFALAYSPDGKRLATGSGDKRIRVYGTKMRNRVNGGRVLYATLIGHTDDVHAVAFSPKRDKLYSAGDDMVVRVWDLKTQTMQETFAAGHTEAIPCLALSPDGALVATGSRDDSIRVWDARTGKLQHLLTDHKNDVHSIAFSPDGKTLASASYDETVKLWDVATGNLKQTFRDHANWVFSLAYSPDGKQIVSADKDGRIIVWDVKTGKKTAEMRRQKHVSCVAFSPDGKYIASTAPSGLISLWNVKTQANIRNLIAR